MVGTLRQVRYVAATGATDERVFLGALGAGLFAALGAYAVVVGIYLFFAAVTIHSFTSVYIFTIRSTF